MPEPTKPFVTDGCSGFMSLFWRNVLGTPPPWEGHCVDHDKAYWRGGRNALRLEADIQLMRGVIANGHPHWAVIMFIAVRIGGMWWLPFPGVRWGYGYDYPQRGLSSDAEELLARRD